ncbi:hypothetical protein ABPG75_002978 [Micractinium tetrahymenae]
MASAPPSFASLPTARLQDILVAAGRKEGRNTSLVCKRWRQAYFGEPRLWRRLEISGRKFERQRASRPHSEAAAWLAGKHCLLQRVGRFADELWIAACAAVGRIAAQSGGPGMPQLLACLDPSAVRTVVFRDVDGPTLGALSPFTRLRSLDLHQTPEDPALFAGLVGWLGSMPGLRKLSLSSEEGFAGGLAGIAGPTRLTSLSLHSEEAMQGAAQLTALSVLRHLSAGSLDGVSPARASCTRCSYSQDGPADDEDEGSSFGSQHLQPYPLRGRYLTLNDVSCSDEGGPPPPLLPPFLPPGQSLRGLNLWGEVPAAALQGCGAVLSSLTSLILGIREQREEGGEGAADAGSLLGVLLQQAPRLRQLQLTGGSELGGVLPDSLLQCTSLRYLGLDGLGLTSLPEGLRVLDLSRNPLPSLPPALSSATSLRQLSLARDGIASLEAASLSATLGNGRLQLLDLSGNEELSGVPGGSWLAGLRVLSLHDTGIHERPPSLEAAMHLTALKL